MNEPKLPTRMGRPPRFPEEGPRTNHSLRLKPSISQALREAAEINNRSLAEEMEYRINQSFEISDMPPDIEAYREVVDKLLFDRILNSYISESNYYVNEIIRNKDRRYMVKLQIIVDKYRSGAIGRFKKMLGNRISKYISFEEEMASLEIRNAEAKIEEIEEAIKELYISASIVDEKIIRLRENNKHLSNLDIDTSFGLDLIKAKKMVSRIRP